MQNCLDLPKQLRELQRKFGSGVERPILRLMVGSLVEAAARNNAEWCHAFCCTHGVVGQFEAGRWFSPERTPPYYPDAVTLRPEIRSEAVLVGIDASEGCSVKDSFACLDLAPAGFRILFRAEWLVRHADAPVNSSRAQWSLVTTNAQLREWESAWGESPGIFEFFRPSLLQVETIRVLAGRDGDRIVAGAIANRSGAVIGLSNVFDKRGDLESAWRTAVALAEALWGEMPTVSYESGESVDAAHGAGFTTLGELVVWLNSPLKRAGSELEQTRVRLGECVGLSTPH